jgi:HSP20 family protein
MMTPPEQGALTRVKASTRTSRCVRACPFINPFRRADMARLTPFDPFRPLSRFDPSKTMEELFPEFRMRPWSRGMDVEPQIRMDVSEDDKTYTVVAEIPGVKKDDIQVNIEGNQVAISAELKQEREEKKGEAVLCRERYYGKLYRSFTLDHDIDDSKSEAKYHDGVLELKLPKASGGAVKKIKIQ